MIINIIFLVLKIIGILLLVVLALLLLIVLSVLLVPVRYSLNVEHGAGICAEGRVNWLLHLINTRISYSDNVFHIRVRILFFTLFDNLKPKKPKKAKSTEKVKKAKKVKNAKKQKKSKLRTSQKNQRNRISNTDNKKKYNTDNLDDTKKVSNLSNTNKDASNTGKVELNRMNTDKDSSSKDELKGINTDKDSSNKDELKGINTDKDSSSSKDELKGLITDKDSSSNKDELKQKNDDKEIHKNNTVNEAVDNKETLVFDSIDDKSYNKGNKRKSSILTKIKNIYEKIKKFVIAFKDKIVSIFNTATDIRQKLKSIKDFLQDTANREGFRLTYSELKKILKHILPVKLKSTIRFGTGDPCTTGQALGAMSILYSFYGDKISITPDFENMVFEGKHYARGRIRLITLLMIVLKYIRDDRFKGLKRNFQLLKEAL